MKLKVHCQKLSERIHWKSNGLLVWSLPLHITSVKHIPWLLQKTRVGQAETTMEGSRVSLSILVNWKNRDWPHCPWSHNTVAQIMSLSTALGDALQWKKKLYIWWQWNHPRVVTELVEEVQQIPVPGTARTNLPLLFSVQQHCTNVSRDVQLQ